MRMKVGRGRREVGFVARRVIAALAVVFMIGCTAIANLNNGLDWKMAESSCSVDHFDGCTQACHEFQGSSPATDQGNGRNACRMLTILLIERDADYMRWRHATGNNSDLDDARPDQILDLDAQLQDACKEGIDRACKATRLLKPRVDAIAARRADEKKKEDTRVTTQADFATRLDAAVATARKALSDAGPDATTQLREAVSIVERGTLGAKKNLEAPDMKDRVEKIEEWAKTAAKLSGEIVAAREKRDAKKNEVEAVREAWRAAMAKCKQDVPGCKKQCDAGPASLYECQFVSISYEQGDAEITKAPDVAKAMKLAKDGCAAGNKVGCLNVDRMQKTALECADLSACKPYCDGGVGIACTSMGEMLRDGRNGEKKDASRALSFFVKACGLDDPSGCYDLGNAQFLGIGGLRDRASAEKSFTKSCDLWTKEVAAQPKQVVYVGLRDTACHEAYGTKCANRVKVAANRRPQEDATCKTRAIGPVAWSTLDGTDADECMNAMMNLGCTEAIGHKVYCCPVD
jgi:TPR repeat protein